LTGLHGFVDDRRVGVEVESLSSVRIVSTAERVDDR
jgi:hypothetical protein